MSIRTEWARVGSLGVEVTGEYVDVFGTSIDAGGVALVVAGDSALVIEAGDVEQVRGFAAQIVTACDRFELARAEQ